jgi:hypothetical protein
MVNRVGKIRNFPKSKKQLAFRLWIYRNQDVFQKTAPMLFSKIKGK